MFCSNMTMLGPILPVELLQQSKICPSSVFHIRRTHQTSSPVTFMSLDHLKRRWQASLSGQTKRCSRRCKSGCVLSQKNFFLEVSMHFRNAGTLVWNAVETTWKNEVTVYLLCSKNYEIKILKFFHLTHPRKNKFPCYGTAAYFDSIFSSSGLLKYVKGS